MDVRLLFALCPRTPLVCLDVRSSPLRCLRHSPHWRSPSPSRLSRSLPPSRPGRPDRNARPRRGRRALGLDRDRPRRPDRLARAYGRHRRRCRRARPALPDRLHLQAVHRHGDPAPARPGPALARRSRLPLRAGHHRAATASRSASCSATRRACRIIGRRITASRRWRIRRRRRQIVDRWAQEAARFPARARNGNIRTPAMSSPA